MARGFDSAGRVVEVAYETRALTTSRSSSIEVGGKVDVADCTTSCETWLIRAGRRCRARCCRMGEGVDAELVLEGKGRKEAASKVDEQWIAVRPTCIHQPNFFHLSGC